METETVEYYSEGQQMKGLLRKPPDADDEELPVIVQGPGLLGLKEFDTYERYHRDFIDAGYAVLIFDYRGFGESEGESILLPDRQVEDIRNTISYAQTRDDLDEKQIGVIGVGGTGGANAIQVAGVDDRVRCTIAMNAFGNGAEWVRSHRREYEWIELLNALEEDRKNRALTGESEMIPARGPDNALHITTPERQERSSSWKPDIDAKVPQELPLKCAEAIIEFTPEDVVPDISPRAIMFITVEHDDVTPEEQAVRMYEKAEQPKKLIYQKDTTHYEAYDKNYDRVTRNIIEFLDSNMAYDDVDVLSEGPE